MNSRKTIFSQLMDFLTMYEFRKYVEKYDGNYKIKNSEGSLRCPYRKTH